MDATQYGLPPCNVVTDRDRRTVDEERQSREAALDHTIEDSFPASDPPSSIPNPYSPEPPYPDHEVDLSTDLLSSVSASYF
jgi:hypothetical protein